MKFETDLAVLILLVIGGLFYAIWQVRFIFTLG